jgi:monofunctional biosynthetic peptidoglycan transglycosylase
MNPEGEFTIFDFSDPQSLAAWGPIDDRVMGGISRSRFESTESNTAVFSGNVSFEQGGGFASVRTRPGTFDLSSYAGLVVHVRGDGKNYKLSLTTDLGLDSLTYRSRFTTEPGKWITVKIPFDQFQPTFRGSFVPDAPPLNSRSIRTFGFLISDRQEGSFQVEIAWIKAYRN